MKQRSGKPKGPFHVQVVKGKRLSNDLANRLNDYRHQFPNREIVAVNVIDTGFAADDPVLYEVVWEAPPK